MFKKKKVSNGEAPFSFSNSNIIPSNSMDTLSIVVLIPKETPNNFRDLTKNGIRNKVNREIVIWDGKKERVN